MNPLMIVMLVFAVLGALDRILGNRFGIGKEFENGILIMGHATLSMLGLLILAPAIAEWIRPVTDAIANTLPIDPSVLPAILFANDMGGAPLATELARDPVVGGFNAMVVASMMGCTVSFTLPFALGVVPKERHTDVLTGILCGIVTIPVGCFFAGLIARVPVGALLIDLVPLILLSALIAFGLLRAPRVCVKVFSVFGKGIQILVTVGLVIGIAEALCGIVLLPQAERFEKAGIVILNIGAALAGALPMIWVIAKLLKRPLEALGRVFSISALATAGLLSTLATSSPTFGMMKDMDRKGIVLNSAFSVSAAFVVADHLAYTVAFNASYVLPMIVGKLIAGFLSLAVALFVCNRMQKKETPATAPEAT